jgi:tetratricopeptide (TPR) repeat protein
MFNYFFKIWGSILIYGALFGCVGPAPIAEYNIAEQALLRAEKAGAQKLSSGRWHKANRFYKSAQEYYVNRDYDEAFEYFEKTRLEAEQAENISRVKKFETGEGP